MPEYRFIVNPVFQFFSVTLSPSAALRINSPEGLVMGRTPTPDASPLRLAQHDISAGVDEHLLVYKNLNTG